MYSFIQIRTNLISNNHFDALFTVRDLTNWVVGLARYDVRWDDTRSIAMVILSIIYY